MNLWERRLAAVMRIIGAVSMLAVVAVFMPRAWMDACHQWLGMGPLPDGPIVEYLARSTSMFYAFLGAAFWYVGGRVREYPGAVRGLAVAVLIGGAVLLTIDLRSGMPWWWLAAEGPFVMIMGTVLLVLQNKARQGR
jgi:hypothetical protein